MERVSRWEIGQKITSLSLLLLTSLTFFMGNQLLLLIAPMAFYYLSDTVGLSIGFTWLFGIIPMGATLVVFFLVRRFPLFWQILFSSGCMMVGRAVVQFRTDGVAFVVFALIGILGVILMTYLLLMMARYKHAYGVIDFALGLILGLTLNSTFRSTSFGVDFTWYRNAGATVGFWVVFALYVALLIMVYVDFRRNPLTFIIENERKARLLDFIGVPAMLTILFLYQALYQNMGVLADLGTLEIRWSSLTLAGGNVLSILLTTLMAKILRISSVWNDDEHFTFISYRFLKKSWVLVFPIGLLISTLLTSHSYIAVHFIGLVCAGPVLLILVYCTLLHKPSGRNYSVSKRFRKKPNPTPNPIAPNAPGGAGEMRDLEGNGIQMEDINSETSEPPVAEGRTETGRGNYMFLIAVVVAYLWWLALVALDIIVYHTAITIRLGEYPLFKNTNALTSHLSRSPSPYFILFFNLRLTIIMYPVQVIPLISAAILIVVTFILTSRHQNRRDNDLTERSHSTSIFALFFLILIHSLTNDPDYIDPPATFPINIKTYNIHGGFSAETGSPELDDLEDAIRLADPAIVILQEAHRGSLMAGGGDIVGWLAEKLGYRYVVYYNSQAIISRYYIKSMIVGLVTPKDNYPLVSYLFSSIDVNGVNLDICNLHLFPEVENRDEIHIAEIRNTVELFGDLPLLVVAGDFNMNPANPGLEYLRNASFQDAWIAGNGPLPGYTNPTEDPYQRIDFIWVSQQIEVQNVSLIASIASDHKALWATINI